MRSNNDGTIKTDWRGAGFDPYMQRPIGPVNPNDYIGGANFDIRLDDIAFNRVIQFKNLTVKPQGNDAGKTYYDPVSKKLYIWIDATGKWAEILYTSTSTSTTSSSSSSSSISTTSTSISTTSTSTSVT